MTQDGRRRAALLSPRVWHSTWGQEKNLAQGLAERFRVDVLDIVDFGRRHALAGRHHFPPPPGGRVIERATPPGLPLQALWLELANGWRILLGGYDLMVSYLTAGALLAMLAARLRGTRILLVYADDYVAFYARKSRLAGWLTARLFNPLAARLAHRVAATARLLAEDLRPFAGQVVRLPNGVDAGRLAAVPAKVGGPFTVGFVGGFGHWVDFETVAAAARLLPATRFILVGGGDRHAEVAAMTAGLDNVEFTGQVDYDRVLTELSRMDACLIPFKPGPLTDRVSPIKLFEYWAAGRPVIASPALEIAETAGDAVLYYQPGDAPDLAARIAELAGNKDLAGRLAAAARARLAAHDWGEIIKGYWRLIDQMLPPGGRS